MKRRVSWAIIAPMLVLGGCRGVLGIEDLDVRADGGAGTIDAATDGAMGADATMGMDARSDAPAVPDIDAGCQASTGMACGMCCRMVSALQPGFTKFEGYAKQTGCVSCTTGGNCDTECAGDLCMGGKAQMQCGGCVDKSVREMPGTPLSSQCQAAVAMCNADSDCHQVLVCQFSCNPPP